ncbi:MAG: DUF2062 domain-containing protein [Akkermansiaceae bacterium]|nr:DUF2062 domain-containing protein [Akkermansiaceae bacterium]
MKRHYLRLVRRAFRALRHPNLRHRGWWKWLSAPLLHRSFWVPCRDSVATGLSAGLFFSMMPVPFQMVFAALVAARFRGNVPIAMGACWLSNPLTQVPIWLFQFRMGDWLRHFLSIPMPEFLVRVDLELAGAGSLNAAGFVLGFITCGVVLALAAFPLTHLFSLLMPHHLPRFRVRRKSRPQPPPAE